MKRVLREEENKQEVFNRPRRKGLRRWNSTPGAQFRLRTLEEELFPEVSECQKHGKAWRKWEDKYPEYFPLKFSKILSVPPIGQMQLVERR